MIRILLFFVLITINIDVAVAKRIEILPKREIIYGQRYKVNDIFMVFEKFGPARIPVNMEKVFFHPERSIKRDQKGIIAEWVEVDKRIYSPYTKNTLINGAILRGREVLFFETGIFTVTVLYEGKSAKGKFQVLLPAEFRQDEQQGAKYSIRAFDNDSITCWYKVKSHYWDEEGKKGEVRYKEVLEEIPIKKEIQEYFYKGGFFEKLEVVTWLHCMILKKRHELLKEMPTKQLDGHSFENLFKMIDGKLKDNNK